MKRLLLTSILIGALIPYSVDELGPAWPRVVTSSRARAQDFYPPSPDFPSSTAPGSNPASLLFDSPLLGPTSPQSLAPTGQLSAPQTTPPATQIQGAGDGQGKFVTSAQVLARVGQEVVLASEIVPSVDAMLLQAAAQHPEVGAQQLNAQRMAMIQSELAQAIQRKMLYADARRTIPAANWPKAEESVTQHFEEKELPAMLERLKVGSRKELDALLRSQGSSLERYRKTFIERNIAHSWFSEQTKYDQEVTEYELRKYYSDHIKDYEFPAKAKWREITVGLRGEASREECYQKIYALGNRVALRGEPFEQVAREGSDGFTSDAGGMRDWTTQGSLVSQVLDRYIFGLPVGGLSPVIEDEQSLRIIQVVERHEAGRTPFEEVQAEILKTIKAQRKDEAEKAYIAKLERLFPITTVFDSTATAQSEGASDARLR